MKKSLMFFVFLCAVCGDFGVASEACTSCSSAYQQEETKKKTLKNYDGEVGAEENDLEDYDGDDEEEEFEFEEPSTQNDNFGPNGGCLVILENGFAVVEIILDVEEGVFYALPMESESYDPISLEAEELEIKIFAMNWSSRENEGLEFPLVLSLRPLRYDWDGEITVDRSQFELEHEDLKNVVSFEGIISHIEIAGREFKNVPINYIHSATE